MKKIGLISAIRQEIQPVINRFPFAVQTQLNNLPAWRFNLYDNEVQLGNNPDKLKEYPFSALAGKCLAQCIIVESGIGMSNASHATEAILESFNPDIILSIGFCGALRTGVITGDLVLAEQLFLHKNGCLEPQAGLEDSPEIALPLQTAKFKLYRGTFITTETMVSKERIKPLLDEKMQTPVLEMESSAVSRICSNAGIQFAAIRSVSDPAGEDPFQLVCDIIGPNFHIYKKRAFVALLKKPGHLPQLLRLARNAQLAGKSLADAVSCFLEGLSCG